jgi:Protein of unknown function (DUF3048) N-terminal domain/Protein of unknown function (DUF3048) C-terminal domain
MPRRTLIAATIILLSMSVLVGACVLPPPQATPDSSTSTTVALPTWPLTGQPSADVPSRGAHPAIVVKMDNSPDARPQTGIERADLVYELLVEGITRFALVFHSELPEPVGPVRSARSSDIDLVSDLSTPLFAWSGGNPGVTGEVAAAAAKGLLTDASYSAAFDAYFRSNDRIAPHNLYVNLPKLLELKAPAGQGAPTPVFTYRRADAVPTGVPALGLSVDFGMGTVIDYLWDATRGGWRRFQVDGSHRRADSATMDQAGGQVTPANVVVMFTEYGQSPSDSRSPMALTVGSGRAIVYSAGRAVGGTWTRPDARAAAVLRDTAGTVIDLTPGRTWVELPRTDSTVTTYGTADQAGIDQLVSAQR